MRLDEMLAEMGARADSVPAAVIDLLRGLDERLAAVESVAEGPVEKKEGEDQEAKANG